MVERTSNEVFEILVASVNKVVPRNEHPLTMDTHLVGDGVLDSLDVMSFLFEFEQQLGCKLDAIDEKFDDFRISRLVEIASQAH
jgi:acyl carrier protein